MKLIEIKKLNGTVSLLSGLHIGAGDDEIKIGGIDNPVIKDIQGIPYIPGSSIKGKVRTLLEWAKSKVGENGKPYATADSDDLIARIFGNGDLVDEYMGGPTRACFRDARMCNEKELRKLEALTEAKMEIMMNRITGAVHKVGPRMMERVPAGAEFDLEITLKIFDMGDGGEVDRQAFALLREGLNLLEADRLGGCGSRGYGRIKIENLDESVAWSANNA